MKLIPLMNEYDAGCKKCPFIMDKDNYPINCTADECMAWIRVQRSISKPDTDIGARAALTEFGIRYGVVPDKRGAPDNYRWEIPNLGYCKRLWPNAEHVTGPEYDSIATTGTWEEYK